MKKDYTLKLSLLFVIATFCFVNLTAQVRILKLDPATNSVTLKNFGNSNVPISGYWFCNRPAYAAVSGMTSVTSLDPGEEVNIASAINFAVADGEFGLYTDNTFGLSTAIIDYLQWGNAGHGRESVAVAAGLWAANTFVDIAPPYQYSGDGTQNGVANWSTLGIDDFKDSNNFILYPNPTTSILNIEFKTMISDGTLEIYNMLGQQIFKQNITADNLSEINVTSWKSGLYLIKISSENSVDTKRFVKS